MPLLRGRSLKENHVPPDVLAVLRAPEGAAAIDDAVAALARGDGELSVLSALRRTHPPAVAAEILTQARLRPKALAKVGPRAQRMLLIDESLQQASRAEVSALRARRLLERGVTAITDAGAGIGADTIAYAEAGLEVTAIERDPDVAAVLRHNTRGLRVTVIEGDATENLPAAGTVYFDPARRSDGRRIFDPEACTPPLSSLVSAYERGLAVVAKMSPSLDLAQVPTGWDVDWVSTQTEQGRSVVEAVLWSPPLAVGTRSAYVLRPGSAAVIAAGIASPTDVPDAEAIGRSTSTPAAGTSAATGSSTRVLATASIGRPTCAPAAASIGRYIYEPDGAVNQAELIGVLADQIGAGQLTPQIAYLTGDLAIETPLAHRYEVLESLSWSKRAVARALASYDAADLVVKKRGVNLDPTALRKELLPRLRSHTGDPIVLILLPYAGAELAVLARG